MARWTARAKRFFLAACMVALFGMQLTPAYALTLPPLATSPTVRSSGVVISTILQCKSVQTAIKNGITSIIGFFKNGNQSEPYDGTTAEGAAGDAAAYLTTATTATTEAAAASATIVADAAAASTAITTASLAKKTLDSTGGPVITVVGTSAPNPAAAIYATALTAANLAIAVVNKEANATLAAAAKADAAANGAFNDANLARTASNDTAENDDPTDPTDAAEIAADAGFATAAATSADAAATQAQAADLSAKLAQTALDTITAQEANATTTVIDPAMAQKLDAIIAALTGIQSSILSLKASGSTTQKAATTTSGAASAAANKATCLDTVERAAAQVVLKEITKETVNWINTGFHGNPLYIQDTGSFLAQIQKQEIGDFTNSIGFDPTKYPFGKTVAQQLVNATGNYFQKAEVYSLNQVIAEKTPGANTASFQLNFANGGWDAFNSQFNENNNPIGFSLAAQSALSSQIANTAYDPAQDIKDQLQRNGGFLDLKSCVNPANSDYSYPDSRCKQWQTDTPGGVIVKKLDDTLGSPLQELSLGNDLTTDLTAVLNALLNQGVQYSLKKIDTSKL